MSAAAACGATSAGPQVFPDAGHLARTVLGEADTDIFFSVTVSSTLSLVRRGLVSVAMLQPLWLFFPSPPFVRDHGFLSSLCCYSSMLFTLEGWRCSTPYADSGLCFPGMHGSVGLGPSMSSCD
ncbi:hypothetical protein MPH_08658 [Macrophomina phaseolina MS6]|uniref:Uncharacterized protein n=1 Tax=Macrophomina phaseolina (strain MS6) TaxID=1126212 RepID=K2SBG1_MACPH|nr:hypothetical protein MPH_08658 [Macrophomina phaseolina MS6]